jgi:response regulator RpfG family c-di-GMP phosphodiesterase
MGRVLVVDDERECRHALADAIASKGLEPETAENGRVALKQIQREPSAYSLVYSDLQMPEVGGLELIERVSALDRTIVPVLLTGCAGSVNAIAAMRAGAFDFLTKPFTLSELEMSLARAMERRKVLLQHEQDRVRLEHLLEASEAEKKSMLLQHENEMRRMFVSSVRAHARSIEAKDAYTAGHCDRVERYAELLARTHGGFDEKWIFNLRVASILHDIGKIGVRNQILCKPGALDQDECDEIRSHPAIGGRIVRTLYGFNIEPAVRHHHERFDGTGYPNRLKGQMIPLESRAILIADTFDAMTSDRPYRRAMSTSDALDELKRNAGSQFDPALVEVAVAARSQFENARVDMTRKPRGDYFTQ